ncbi:DNA-binding protein [Sulfolobales archaeon HS-7]|nr:DNA-binding protein [Sulfolobales archaeon HS-7]
MLRRKAASMRKKEDAAREAQIRAQKEAILRSILTEEARQRLANIRLVRPEIVDALENQLIALAQSGRVRTPVSDEELKELLEQLFNRDRRDYNIKIKERGWK